MIETGTIKEIEGSRVVIGCGDTAGCKTCGGRGFCSVKERTYDAVNDRNLPLEVGDQVNIHLPSGQTVFAAFLVMIVPLLLFILFFVAAGRWFGVTSEALRALFGVAGLGAGFLLSFLYSRDRRKVRLPRVVDRIG